MLIISLCFSSCLSMKTGYINNPSSQADIEKNKRVEKKFINLAPLYGYYPKDNEYKDADNKFIAIALSDCKCDSSTASKIYSKFGWDYFRDSNFEVASKRFNQAYLLDSTNFHIYWGFAAIMGHQRRNDESIILFNKALSFSSENNDASYVKLCVDAIDPYIDKFEKSSNKEILDEALKILNKASDVMPNDIRLNQQFTRLYLKFEDYEKSLEY